MRQLLLLSVLVAISHELVSAIPSIQMTSLAKTQQNPLTIQDAHETACRANANTLENQEQEASAHISSSPTDSSTAFKSRLEGLWTKPAEVARHVDVIQDTTSHPIRTHSLESSDMAAMPTSRKVSKKLLFISCLSFMTGFVDILCYDRYHCYVNMMTGNSIRLVTALAESQWAAAFFFVSLLTSYSVGIMSFRVIDLTWRRHREQQLPWKTMQPEIRTCVLAAPLMLLLCCLADVVSHHFANHRIHAPLMSMAFGILNAATAEATGGTILYAMTGHVTKIAKSIADSFADSKRSHRPPKTSLTVLGSFLAGVFLSVKAKPYMLPLIEQGGVPFCSIVGLIYTILLLSYGRLSFSHFFNLGLTTNF